MKPMKMKPVFKDYLWGGNKLNELFDKQSPLEITAESWEIASHSNGESTCDGKTIKELTAIYKEQLLGDKIYKGDDTKFPLLIKFIDAKDNLSIQVHPDDSYAYSNENGELGKTEMWYVLDAEPGAELLYGFKEAITKEQFEASIKDNTLLDYVNHVPCHKGDCFFIPSGTLHAIGKGLLIAEIQQNSDTTYRVYDYNRKDAQGNTRPLHIEKAIDVTDTTKTDVSDTMSKDGVLVKCGYFTTEKITVTKKKEIEVSKDRFETVIVCEGKIVINDVECIAGDCLLIPAYIGSMVLEGNGVILRSYL